MYPKSGCSSFVLGYIRKVLKEYDIQFYQNLCKYWSYFSFFRSFPQLRATFEEYGKFSEKDIEQVIKDEMSGDIQRAMVTIGTNTYLAENQYIINLKMLS